MSQSVYPTGTVLVCLLTEDRFMFKSGEVVTISFGSGATISGGSNTWNTEDSIAMSVIRKSKIQRVILPSS